MRAAARLLLRQEMGIWLLLMLALACLPWALRREAPDAAFTLLFPAVLVAASGAYALSRPAIHTSPAAAGFAGLGALVMFIRIGQTGEAIGAALLATLRLAGQLILPSQNVGQQLAEATAWLGAQREAWAQVAGFSQRAETWLLGLLQGRVVDDPSSRALFLGLGLWLLAFWAGRRLRLKDDPLGSLLPATAALAFTLNQTVQDRWPLWLHLAALLALLGVTHLARLTRSWRSAHTDYSDSIPEESLLSGLVLILLVLSTAFAVSTFSLDDFLDRFRRREPATASGSETAGHRPTSGTVRSGGAAGLQNAHLITAGPSLSQDVVMYIRTGDLPPMPPTVPVNPPRYYWRGQTYQSYNGHAWSNRSRTDLRLEQAAQIMELSPAGFRKVHGRVEIPLGLSGLAYWTGALVSADIPLDVAWRPGSGSNPARPAINAPQNVDMIGAISVEEGSPPIETYSFDSLVSEASEAQLQAAPATYPDWVSRQYLALPDSVPERVRALARDITVRGQTPYDRAVAIERYLRLIPYSLDVPAPPSTRDATDYFLFELKQGYCDYYATAMTVMARAAGLPARLVTGYASGSYDSYSAEYVVREADAHSWTEIYFAGIGWIEFEPTASQPLPHRETVHPAQAASEARPAARPTWVIMPSVDARRLGAAWLLIPLMGCLYAGWLLVDGTRLRWMSTEAAIGAIYRRMHRATRRLAGAQFAGETARERAELISSSLSAVSSRGRMWAALVGPTIAAIGELTDLHMLRLFAPAPLASRQKRAAIAVWSGLRWRLGLLNILLAISRPIRRGAPSETRARAAG